MLTLLLFPLSLVAQDTLAPDTVPAAPVEPAPPALEVQVQQGAQLIADWKNIFCTQIQKTLQEVLGQHELVFSEGLGKIKGVQASLHVNPEAQPRFYKPRPVPYALRKKVGKELDRLEEEGVILKVQHSEWAAPIVPVLKPNGTVRICGDYR